MERDADPLAAAKARAIQRVPVAAAGTREEEVSVHVDERTGTRERAVHRRHACVSSTSWTSAELAARSIAMSVSSSCAIDA